MFRKLLFKFGKLMGMGCLKILKFFRMILMAPLEVLVMVILKFMYFSPEIIKTFILILDERLGFPYTSARYKVAMDKKHAEAEQAYADKSKRMSDKQVDHIHNKTLH